MTRRDLLPLLLAMLLALLPLYGAAVQPLEFKDTAEEQRFQHLTRQLRCLVCQNQNLADSDAGLAGDLRREVFEQLRAGKSDDEIKQYLVSRYSQFVLYDPPLSGSTWLLWFGPLLALLVGAGVVTVIVRRRAANAATAPQTRGPAHEEEDW
ncbi:cytochrome c-type biogenesis protein CcmH [Tahibacter aquaticus]|uniref:Cytochrome c-type biogenesis protein n=1 Tax=Tahibacter aquaticus TaxID=520092 RepID=A0A4V3DM74_9GAMM|nr:cytochrome c-type biogenesis protein [Tahibacter aquaticus]TDR43209.1 cytochrome c-type biogenesis protein CcmH [Tahibacter aquaticus]